MPHLRPTDMSRLGADKTHRHAHVMHIPLPWSYTNANAMPGSGGHCKSGGAQTQKQVCAADFDRRCTTATGEQMSHPKTTGAARLPTNHSRVALHLGEGGVPFSPGSKTTPMGDC